MVWAAIGTLAHWRCAEAIADEIVASYPFPLRLKNVVVLLKLIEISSMRDAIAKDLWDAQQSPQAQVIHPRSGQEAATQAGIVL